MQRLEEHISARYFGGRNPEDEPNDETPTAAGLMNYPSVIALTSESLYVEVNDKTLEVFARKNRYQNYASIFKITWRQRRMFTVLLHGIFLTLNIKEHVPNLMRLSNPLRLIFSALFNPMYGYREDTMDFRRTMLKKAVLLNTDKHISKPELWDKLNDVLDDMRESYPEPHIGFRVHDLDYESVEQLMEVINSYEKGVITSFINNFLYVALTLTNNSPSNPVNQAIRQHYLIVNNGLKQIVYEDMYIQSFDQPEYSRSVIIPL